MKGLETKTSEYWQREFMLRLLLLCHHNACFLITSFEWGYLGAVKSQFLERHVYSLKHEG